MLWSHTKKLNVSNKHRKSKIANRKSFIFSQDNFFATWYYLLPSKAQILQILRT